MYTKHKVKKRKTWSDGALKIKQNGACSLNDESNDKKVSSSSSSVLDTTFLDPVSLSQVLQGEDCEIEFDGYLCTVDAIPVESNVSSNVQPPNKIQKVKSNLSAPLLKPFLKPTQYKPPSVVSNAAPSHQYSAGGGGGAAVVKSAYNSGTGTTVSGSGSGTVAGTGVTVTRAALNTSKESIRNRYQNDASVVEREADKRTSDIQGRYAGVAGCNGNGRYIIDDAELDSMWADEEKEEEGGAEQEQGGAWAGDRGEVAGRQPPPQPSNTNDNANASISGATSKIQRARGYEYERANENRENHETQENQNPYSQWGPPKQTNASLSSVQPLAAIAAAPIAPATATAGKGEDSLWGGDDDLWG